MKKNVQRVFKTNALGLTAVNFVLGLMKLHINIGKKNMYI